MHRFVFDSQPARPASAGADSPAETDSAAKRLALASQLSLGKASETNHPLPRPLSRLSGGAANSGRAAAAAAVRVPTRPNSRAGHARDVSLDVPRHRPASSESLAPSLQGKPFWEGSTVDGSVFSENTSQADSRSTARPPVSPIRTSSQHARPTQHTSHKRDSGASRGPFMTMRKDGAFNTRNVPWPHQDTTMPALASKPTLKGDLHDPNFDMNDELEASPSEVHQNLSRGRLPHRTTKPELTPFHTAHGETYSHQTGVYWSTGPGMQAPFEGDGGARGMDDEEYELHHPTDSVSSASPTDRQRTLETQQAYDDGLDDELEEQVTPKAALRRSSQVKRTLFTDEDKGAKATKSRKPLRGNVARLRVTSERHRPAAHEDTGPLDSSAEQPPRVKKRQLECDYDDAALSRMSYEDLMKEDFDQDPAQVESQSAQLPHQGPLAGKMDHFIGKDKEAQAAFFATMPVKDWDEAGDWLLDRFSYVMRELRVARQEKRKMVESFENEIAKREGDVRNKTETIQETLAGLRSEGGRMVRSRGLD